MTNSVVKYIGKGRFMQGVPARDLTIDEWKKIPAKKRRHLERVLKLYEVKHD